MCAPTGTSSTLMLQKVTVGAHICREHPEHLRAKSDQDSVRTAGVASSLIRNTGVKEVMLQLGQTVCTAYIHMHKGLHIKSFADDFQNHSAGNGVTLRYHVKDDGALAT
eukprot:1140913-Pelagomonas_calceolata.AAC.9